MREPAIRTRILASPPIFYGSWGMALWLLYEWSQHGQAWPLVIGWGLFLAGVMKADEQCREYRLWRTEWDQMAGIVRPKRWPVILGAIIGLPITIGLVAVGQQWGVRGILGVLLITLGPIALLGLLLKFWGAYRRLKGGRVEPVRVCVRGPVIPVPTLRDAYLGLPDYCRKVLEPMT